MNFSVFLWCFFCVTGCYFVVELHFKFYIQNVQARHKHCTAYSNGNLFFYLIIGLKFRIFITLDIFTLEVPTLNSLFCFRIMPIGNL